ncbi:MAG: shikimate kinase [Sutterellaceae bacterium]|nr:shikimate kinase [Sutterellaceae bacterium]
MDKTHDTQASTIILIGMMASGKSTVGRTLAKQLGWTFYDSDKEIEKRCGVPVSFIFEKEGEAGFRARETQMLAELTTQKGVVIATGGGTPMFEINQKLLQRGYVIQLTTTVSDVLERTKFDSARPLLQSEDKVARIRELLLARTPTYDAVCHKKIATTRIHPEVVAQKILALPEVQKIVQRIKCSDGDNEIKQEGGKQ